MDSIFKNQDEVVENIKDSAKELGADLGEKKQEEQQHISIKAKQNCKMCWGRGYVTHSFPGNRGNEATSHFYCKCVKFA